MFLQSFCGRSFVLGVVTGEEYTSKGCFICYTAPAYYFPTLSILFCRRHAGNVLWIFEVVLNDAFCVLSVWSLMVFSYVGWFSTTCLWMAMCVGATFFKDGNSVDLSSFRRFPLIFGDVLGVVDTSSFGLKICFHCFSCDCIHNGQAEGVLLGGLAWK